VTTEYPKPGDPLERLDDMLSALEPPLTAAVRVGVAVELRNWVAALRANADEVHGPPAEPDDQLGHLVGERERTLRDVADLIAMRAAGLEDPQLLRPVTQVDEEDVTAFISKWTEAADAAINPAARDFLRTLTEQGSSPTGRILRDLAPPLQPISGRPLSPLFIAANSVTQATEYATRERIRSQSWLWLNRADQLRGYSEPTVWFLLRWWERWNMSEITKLDTLEQLPKDAPGHFITVTDLAQLDPWRVP
jgi:hypothetical protein